MSHFDLSHLIELGFARIGAWSVTSGELQMSLDTPRESTCSVLYAFILNGKVMYLGKTKGTFKQRLGQYLNPGPTQRTNQRVRTMIAADLANDVGTVIDIYGFAPQDRIEFKGWHLDIAAGLEEELIHSFSPAWNRNSK